MIHGSDAYQGQLSQRIEELEAENKRLREALDRVDEILRTIKLKSEDIGVSDNVGLKLQVIIHETLCGRSIIRRYSFNNPDTDPTPQEVPSYGYICPDCGQQAFQADLHICTNLNKADTK